MLTPLTLSQIPDTVIEVIAEEFDNAEHSDIEDIISGSVDSIGGGWDGAFFGNHGLGTLEAYSYNIDDVGDKSIREGVFLMKSGFSAHFYGNNTHESGTEITFLKVFPPGAFPELHEQVQTNVFDRLASRAIEIVADMPPEKMLAQLDRIIANYPALQAVRDFNALQQTAEADICEEPRTQIPRRRPG